MLALVRDASKSTGGMSKQEERDILFARLFGITAMIQSGLVVSQDPLDNSSTAKSSSKSFESVCKELLELGEKKSWLRESCWYALVQAFDALSESDVEWKTEVLDTLIKDIYAKEKKWSPEKVALTLEIRKISCSCGIRSSSLKDSICGTVFKNYDLLQKENLPSLAKILKVSCPFLW
jgi:DNA polymerase phi